MSDVKDYLIITTEFSPSWLDAGENLAFIRHDAEGDNIYQYNLATGEKTRWSKESLTLWEIYSDPQTRKIYYATDPSGSECEDIFVLDAPLTEARALTRGDKVRHFFGGVNPGAKIVAYASNQRSAASFDICYSDLASGEAHLVKEFNDHYNWPTPNAISPNGQYFLFNKLKAENDNALWLCELATGDCCRIPDERLVSAEVHPAWKHDSSGFFYLSERESEFYNLYYYDISLAEARPLLSFDWDIEQVALSYDDRYLAIVTNEAGYSNLQIYDLENRVFLNTLQPPKGMISSYERLAWAPQAHILAFSVQSGARPQGLWLLDIDKEVLQNISQNTLPATLKQQLVEPTLCHYTSFDGLTIDYWLYLPQGRVAENLPCLIEVHGGPEGQERPGFNDFIQYLLSKGIAVVAPNVRGSTGYGKTFTHLDDVEKRLDSVKDIEALVAHLKASKIVNPAKLAISGTSYGGFMTLSCAARLPEVWACAVDNVGMYNLVSFLENTADYRRAHRESEYGSLEHNRELLYEVSPIAKIEDIQAPLMVVQGANDPRVPASEAEQVVTRLRELGREVCYLLYPDEGHGIRKLENRLDCYPKVAKFLLEYLS